MSSDPFGRYRWRPLHENETYSEWPLIEWR
jgi:hypothetical protein